MISIKEIILKLLPDRFAMSFFPEFERTLIKAGIKDSPDYYLNKMFLIAFIASLFFTILLLFVFLKKGVFFLWVLPAFVILFAFFFFTVLQLPKMAAKKRKQELESDLLYTVRHFLLRMECGSSLLNALEETANLDTVSAKYFSEVVHDLNIGSPIEHAIDYAIKYTPSERFMEVMNIIKTSLRTGSDIKQSLKSNLREMSHDKILEIKDYGKKLSPLSMFYMIIGTIVPSIGVSVLVIGSTFFPNIIFGGKAASAILIAFVVLLVIIQTGFYLLFKSMRPLVSV